MYDLLIDIISTLFKHGLSLSSVGAIVFLFLKQKKMKARLKKFWPWMFSDDGEVKEYIVNQQIIMKNQELIMSSMGVEPCVYGHSKKLLEPVQVSSEKSLSLLPLAASQEYQLRRETMKKLIALDDGHGMTTAGKRTPLFSDKTYMPENDFNRAVVDKLGQHLKRCGFEVLYVAPGDDDIPLRTRTNLANNVTPNGFNRMADIYISVHANALGGIWNSRAKGIETFYHAGSKEGKRLAEIIQKHMLRGTKMVDRGLKTGNLHVTRETKMPAVLVECGFMDNPEEAELLKTDWYRAECAEELARGVCEYFGIEFSPVSKEPYPIMDLIVHTSERQRFTGYNIKNKTWIPSRPIGDILGATIEYKNGKVHINGNEVETMLINGIGYVVARDLTKHTGSRIFWDKANPNLVDIFKGE